MKKYIIIIVAIVVSLFYYQMAKADGADADFSRKIIEYQVDGNKYVIVVAEDGLTQNEAQRIALKKASEIAVNKGFQYLAIETENEISVLKSNATPLDDSGPQNMYYEMVESGNFGRRPIDQQNLSGVTLYTGWRIMVSFYKEKPEGSPINACDYTPCKKG